MIFVWDTERWDKFIQHIHSASIYWAFAYVPDTTKGAGGMVMNRKDKSLNV